MRAQHGDDWEPEDGEGDGQGGKGKAGQGEGQHVLEVEVTLDDLAKLLRLAEGGVPADLSKAERALSGFIINAVDERGVVRLSGILTVED